MRPVAGCGPMRELMSVIGFDVGAAVFLASFAQLLCTWLVYFTKCILYICVFAAVMKTGTLYKKKMGSWKAISWRKRCGADERCGSKCDA